MKVTYRNSDTTTIEIETSEEIAVTLTESYRKAPIITIDQVRAVLAEKSGQGKTKEVKALLYKYDAGKLSGVKPEDYPALMEEAQKL